MPVVPIILGGRELSIHKAFVHPSLGHRSVLTTNPWEFVSFWLKRRTEQKEALFYWEQGQRFYRAAENLPLEAAPLLLYYSFMNATKALLSAKKVAFDARHGVQEKKSASSAARIRLSDEAVRIKNSGIVPALSGYYGESESHKEHSLKDILFNIPCIHRTYGLTFVSQKEMFVPITKCFYVVDTKARQAFFKALLAAGASKKEVRKRLPPNLTFFESSSEFYVRSVASIPWNSQKRGTKKELGDLVKLHSSLRLDVQYIKGTETLWYVKLRSRSGKRLSRSPTTLTLIAAHRLSELCRYKPGALSSYLDGKQSWLLSEFVRMTPAQFLDEIASEITGYQFLIPNVRPAKEDG